MCREHANAWPRQPGDKPTRTQSWASRFCRRTSRTVIAKIPRTLPKELATHLNGLSTLSLFLRFARDFRRSEGEPIEFETVDREGVTCIRLKYRDACEFLLTKDYTDNWRSEMHETFCYWSFRDWEAALVEAGFRIHPASNAYQNPWIAKHRWEGKAVLLRSFDDPAGRLSPPTNMLLIGEKI